MLAGWRGGPEKDRRAIARAFMAKAVWNMSTTRQLLERLTVDTALRRICGWESQREIPPMNRSFPVPSPGLRRRNFPSGCMKG